MNFQMQKLVLTTTVVSTMFTFLMCPPPPFFYRYKLSVVDSVKSVDLSNCTVRFFFKIVHRDVCSENNYCLSHNDGLFVKNHAKIGQQAKMY